MIYNDSFLTFGLLEWFPIFEVCTAPAAKTEVNLSILKSLSDY